MPGTYSQILLHVIFSTKCRTPWITPDIADRLYPYMGGIVRAKKGALYDSRLLRAFLRPSRAGRVASDMAGTGGIEDRGPAGRQVDFGFQNGGAVAARLGLCRNFPMCPWECRSPRRGRWPDRLTSNLRSPA